MLGSAEHEILNAHKYKNIKEFSIFQAHIRLERYFPAHKLLAFLAWAWLAKAKGHSCHTKNTTFAKIFTEKNE